LNQKWYKNVPYYLFKQNFDRQIASIYNKFKKRQAKKMGLGKFAQDFNELNFIPTKYLLLKILRVYPSKNWRRDLISHTTIDGEKKLLLIEEFLETQELAIINYIIELPKEQAYKITVLNSIFKTYFGHWNYQNDSDILELDQSQRKIELFIGQETGKLKVLPIKLEQNK